MAKKQPNASNLPESSENSGASGTDEATENSELVSSTTDESNLAVNNAGSLLESKMNTGIASGTPAIKLDRATVDTGPTNQVTLKNQKDNGSSHTFRLEDLNLGSGTGKQASKESSGKQQPLRLGSRQQRILKGLKRNLKRNLKANSGAAASPLKRSSLNELVEMMMQFNLVPKSGRTTTAPKSSALLNSGNESSIPARRREFEVKLTAGGRSKQTSFPTSTQAQGLPARPANYDAGTMPAFRETFRESPINSFYSIYPMVNRAELLDTRILYLFDQITSLLDRFLVLITDFREELAQIENRDIALDRMVFQENNAALLEAITNTLPERLGDRFGRELERALKKFLGDKGNRKQN